MFVTCLRFICSGLAFSAILLLAPSLVVAQTQIATFLESTTTAGQFVIEAETFTARKSSPNLDPAAGWTHADPTTGFFTEGPMAGDSFGIAAVSTRGTFMVIPEGTGAGGDWNLPENVLDGTPQIDYNVRIETTGEYRLYPRWGGVDGGSDNIYATVVGVGDGVYFGDGISPAGVHGIPDWYKYLAVLEEGEFGKINVKDVNGDKIFVTENWQVGALPENTGGGRTSGFGLDDPALFNIAAPGDYTLRIMPREDGARLDALIFQLASLPVPTDAAMAATPTVPIPEPSTILLSMVGLIAFAVRRRKIGGMTRIARY